MNNDRLILEERSRDIGKFMVGRLLPFAKKRQVGPFTFIDHMGPAQLKPGEYIDIDQHPHIGLSTLTYLLEGEIEHKDSTGANQVVTPGAVGFMMAGKGVTHTERTPKALRNGQSHSMHGYQVWVALPKELEEMDPTFQYIAKEALPTWKQGNLMMTLVAGEGYGRRSPLMVYSPLFMIDVLAEADTVLQIAGQLEGEISFVITQGSLTVEGEVLHAGQMLISNSENECEVTLSKGTRLLIFGGKPLEEPRYMFWNFVSSSMERLELAKQDWVARRFPKVSGDDTYIPLP